MSRRQIAFLTAFVLFYPVVTAIGAATAVTHLAGVFEVAEVTSRSNAIEITRDGAQSTLIVENVQKPDGSDLAAAPPASSTDNALARFDGTGGDLQDGQTTEDDSGNVAVVGNLTTTGSAQFDGADLENLSGATDGHALTVQADGSVQPEAIPADTLAVTLTAGNTTGGTDVVLTSGDALVGAAGTDTRIEAPSLQAVRVVGRLEVIDIAEGGSDVVQISHDSLNGTIQSGAGDLVLLGADDIRLDTVSGVIDVRDTIQDFDADWSLTTAGVADFKATTLRRTVESHTASDTLTAAETWKVNDNQGTAGDVLLTLPAIADGLTYTISQVSSSGTIGFEPPAGTWIVSPANGSLSAGQGLWTNAVGTTITVTGSGSAWLVTSEAGTTQTE